MRQQLVRSLHCPRRSVFGDDPYTASADDTTLLTSFTPPSHSYKLFLTLHRIPYVNCKVFPMLRKQKIQAVCKLTNMLEEKAKVMWRITPTWDFQAPFCLHTTRWKESNGASHNTGYCREYRSRRRDRRAVQHVMWKWMWTWRPWCQQIANRVGWKVDTGRELEVRFDPSVLMSVNSRMPANVSLKSWVVRF